MNKEIYDQLIYDFCKHLGLGSPIVTNGVCGIEIGGIEWGIEHGGEKDEEGLYIFSEFGVPPAELKKDMLETLMETNFNSFGKNKPTFGFDRQRDQIILMKRLDLIDLELQDLIDEINFLLEFIMQWRELLLIFHTPENSEQLPSTVQ